MGAALYVVLETRIAGLDTMIDGKALSKAEDMLAKTCLRLGVPPLMDFFSVNEEELCGVLGLEAAAADIPAERWFTAEDGLRTVEALLREVNNDPDLASAKEDLQGFHRVLLEAQRNRIRWHLAVDY